MAPLPPPVRAPRVIRRFIRASDAALLLDLMVDDGLPERAGPAVNAEVNAEVLAEVNAEELDRVVAVFRALQVRAPPWLLELHPAYGSLLVEFDLGLVEHRDVERFVLDVTADLDVRAVAPGRTHLVPVRYGGADGPDLERVAAHAGLSPAEVVRLHAQASYRVAFLGFAPGFAYLVGLPPALTTPRRSTPRASVPAGSVAIGGAQTGIYPSSSPGGWNLVGRTPLALAAGWAEPGDVVRFVPVDEGRGAPAGDTR